MNGSTEQVLAQMADEIERLEAELAHAEAELAELRASSVGDCGHADLIEKIHTWSGAYPIDVFPEPNHAATGHDPTLCSASMGRHVLGRLMEMIDGEDT